MRATRLTAVEPGNRVQLPADWAEGLGLRGLVALELTTEGILVRACPPRTWDAFFATKLQIGPAPAQENQEVVEVNEDDLLF